MPAPNAPAGSRSCFYSGTELYPVYVDYVAAAPGQARKRAIVMLHGGFHTGSTFLATPDGRGGWAMFFSRHGHDVYVPDWPGHGRSPARMPLSTLSTKEVAQALAVLLEDVGPAILLAHSAGGPIAWWLAEHRSHAVAAVVGIAPGPPANIQEVLPDDPDAIAALRSEGKAGCPVYSPLDAPAEVDRAFIREFWANSPRFPRAAIDAYAKSIVPESARVLNERFNIGGTGLRLEWPKRVADRPILIVTGDCDPRHPRDVDAQLAQYFQADFLWLADAGCIGNGHMPMSEDNSDEVASLISQWLERQRLG